MPSSATENRFCVSLAMLASSCKPGHTTWKGHRAGRGPERSVAPASGGSQLEGVAKSLNVIPRDTTGRTHQTELLQSGPGERPRTRGLGLPQPCAVAPATARSCFGTASAARGRGCAPGSRSRASSAGEPCAPPKATPRRAAKPQRQRLWQRCMWPGRRSRAAGCRHRSRHPPAPRV